MYRLLLVHTPSYKNEEYIKTKKIYEANLYKFHKKCLKIKSNRKKDNKFRIDLIGFDKKVKKTYKKLDPKKIISDINKMPLGDAKCNLSLYADYNKKTTITGTGFKNKEKALNTLKLIKNKDLSYKKRVVQTMYNRAKFHPNQTKDMKIAMEIFNDWIKKNT